MATTRCRVSFLSLLLLILFTLATVNAYAAEINANSDTNMGPSYPAHWGPPPRAQTRDLVTLPGEYGRGSSTLRKWILEKMSEDDANAAKSGDATNKDKKFWPEKDLVGLTGEEAKAAVLAGNTKLLAINVQVLHHHSPITMDYRDDRVRIFVGNDGKVVRQPMIG